MSLWSPAAIADLERAEAARRGTTREESIRAAVARHREQMARAGYVGPDGEAVEPVTQMGVK